MTKKDELKPDSNGCLAKANEDEMLFILRAQDMSSPKIIFQWIAENIDTLPDDKVNEAVKCALVMNKHKFRKPAD